MLTCEGVPEWDVKETGHGDQDFLDNLSLAGSLLCRDWVDKYSNEKENTDNLLYTRKYSVMLVIPFILFNFVVLEHFLRWACKVGVDEETHTPGLLKNHDRDYLLQ